MLAGKYALHVSIQESTLMIGKIIKLVSNPRKYLPIAMMKIKRRLYPLKFRQHMPMDIDVNSPWQNPEIIEMTGGFYPKTDDQVRKICDLAPYDRTRRDMLILLMRTVVERKIPGQIAELGVYKGQTAKLFHHYMPERTLHLFDTFEGFTDRGTADEKAATGKNVHAQHFADTSLESVQKYICAKNDNVHYYKGYFPDSVPPELENQNFAFVHLDADLYQPTIEGLKFFYPRMTRQGMIVVHDYNTWIGARKAVDEFFSDKPELPIPMPDKSGTALIVKI